MAEMTAAEAVECLRQIGERYAWRKEINEIAALIQQQAATITELQTEIEYQNKQIARMQEDLSKWQVKEGQ